MSIAGHVTNGGTWFEKVQFQLANGVTIKQLTFVYGTRET